MEEVLARPDLTGLYAKCPDCTCRSNCVRDGKLIVEAAGTPAAYDPPEEFTGTAFDRCPDATAQGRRDRCGQFSHPRRCDDTHCNIAGEFIPESGAHAPDPVDDTTTELADGDFVTYRYTGEGAYDIVLNRAEGPAAVLAMVHFTKGTRGWRHALERITASLGSVSQDVQP